MEEGSFYITLPSNASNEIYSDNKISNYRVKLARPLSLRGAWEVALIEIQYPKTWATFLQEDGTFSMADVRTKEITPCDLREGFYTNIPSIIDEINMLVEGLSEDIEFGYDELIHKVYAKADRELSFIFQGKLARILGLDADKPFIVPPRKKIRYAPHAADFFGGEYSLFVYTDIIEHQIVGDHYVPLLRCVQITGEHTKVVSINYDKPHYTCLRKTDISDIEIAIKNDQNYNIPFQYGKIVVKLHFRPAKQTQRF